MNYILQHQLQEDSTRDDEEAKSAFLDDHRRIHLSSSRCTPSQPVHAERRIVSYSDEVTRTTHTSLDVLLEKHIDDYRNVDGEKELCRRMDRIHKIHLIE